jgi:hypothetical protein
LPIVLCSWEAKFPDSMRMYREIPLVLDRGAVRRRVTSGSH